ncbi:uncharacterized protein PV09_08535 [Verruconis gallopava]|uniref:Heterokaryon incompatibility domain-containing protein n=1 Tax=Verruconis gallopava TaxID=253628 RepID=A0A0D1ZZK9_9PEZI|nr:uncharacterized protein PV09_08535 [Verruconis gallopava]KIV99867.1 hypothetical protein PV09_08535 [Verruconis gallopava]
MYSSLKSNKYAPMHRDQETSSPEDHLLDSFALRKELAPYLPYVDKSPVSTSAADRELVAAYFKPSPWVDLGVIRRWIETCQEYHEDHCVSSDASGLSPWHRPLWLIDASKRCLIPAQADMKYFALSYVWGNCGGPNARFCLQKSNLDRLLQPGCLRRSEDGRPVLPKLVDDVIELVDRLGWRYIWVDRYCIVQDDGPAKDAQINAMNSIYSSAFATIVAADGDAEAGIKGVREYMDPRGSRTIMDHVIELPTKISDDDDDRSRSLPSRDEKVVGREWLEAFRAHIHVSDADVTANPVVPNTLSRASSYDSFDSFVVGDGARQQMMEQQRSHDRKVLEAKAYLLMHSPWYSRGWTFQEALFSKRKIIFQNDTVNWECHCSAWYEGQESFEDVEQRPCVKRPGFSTESGFDSALWPDLYRYGRLVALFNRRDLTYPDDALYAFAGVMSSLSLTFMHGFVSGLPQMFFHSTLIWQPYRPLSRRKGRIEEKAILPSWSWAGWHGIFQYESWRSGYSYIKSLATEEGLDMTTWETHETVTWYRIDDKGQKHKIKAMDVPYDSSDFNEHGWSCIRDENSGTSIYRHDSIPDTEFWRPVQLRDATKARVPPMYCRFLSSETNAAVLKTGESFRRIEASRCVSVDLIDDRGQWVGILRLMTDDAAQDRYELVELSAGSVQNRPGEQAYFDEWDRAGLSRCWRDDNKYEFYNVMAVSRVHGISYRVAVGRVEKESWERLRKGGVEITLG